MCKKLICLIFFMLISGIAQGWEWDRAAYWDSRYPTGWAAEPGPTTVRDALDAAGYAILDADQLKTWMDGHIADGEPSVVVMCKDIVPDTVAETMTANCTFRQYLDAGGKVVWFSDWPIYYQGLSDGTSAPTWGSAGAVNVLGFNASDGTNDTYEEVAITEAGAAWGLTETWQSQRTVSAANATAQDLTILATIGGGGSVAGWVKHYVPGDTYRGFVRIFDRTGTPTNVDDIIRLAEYAARKAESPIPANGANVGPISDGDNVYLMLDYTPGSTAIEHRGYFSDVRADVNDRVTSAYLGTPTPWPTPKTRFVVGLDDDVRIPNAFARLPLVRGKTYYWCVDESDGVTTWPGEVWSFTVMPEEAWDPTPADGAHFVATEPDLTLSWKLGDLETQNHSLSFVLYWGTDEAAVEAATTGGTTIDGGTTIPGETISTIVTGLPAETEIFWRVDTKRMLLQGTFPTYTTKGIVWSFTTLPTVPVTDPDLIGWWKLDGEYEPVVFDYSGYGNHGIPYGNPLYVPGEVDMAMEFDGSNDYVDTESTQFDVPDAVTVAVWINQLTGGTDNDRGIVGNGGGWEDDGFTFWQNPSDNIRAELQGPNDKQGITTPQPPENEWHHIAFTWEDVSDTVTIYIDGQVSTTGTFAGPIGLATMSLKIGTYPNLAQGRHFHGQVDDVRVYKRSLSTKEIKVLAGILNADNPDPAIGATGVSRMPTLSWDAGAFAALVNGHMLYLSDDKNQVVGRTVAPIPLSNPFYGITSQLDLGETYYWIVDEVNGSNIWEGDLWDFTVIDYLSVDDMETYTEWRVADNNIFEVWVDGMGNCKGSGNDTGANIFESPGNGVGGSQAMQFSYDNDGMVVNPCLTEPADEPREHYYSKAEAEVGNLPSGIGSNWTIDGVRALSLMFYGTIGNTIEPMWVKLTDTSNNSFKVVYGVNPGESPTHLEEVSWHEWNIALSDFIGVNLADIKSMAIGVGNEGSPIPGGSGLLYFDQIRLYTPRCILDRRSAGFAKYDYAPRSTGGDCVVDNLELELMTRDWLELDYMRASNPLIARWQLDGNYDDDSGHGNTGTPVGAGVALVTDPERGQVLSLPGGDDIYVDCGDVGISGTDPRTIACWAKANNTSIPDWTLIFGFTGMADGTGGGGSHFNIGSLGGPGGVGAHVWGWEETIFSDEEALDWHHYAMTYDGTTILYYGDGQLMDTDVGKSNVQNLVHADRVHIGSRITQASSFPGLVDDACIFDIVLDEGEIGVVMAGGAATLDYHPLTSPANVSDNEPKEQKKVNFLDYADLLSHWLDEGKWPAP